VGRELLEGTTSFNCKPPIWKNRGLEVWTAGTSETQDGLSTGTCFCWGSGREVGGEEERLCIQYQTVNAQ